jgi:ribosome-binding factor A
VPANKGFSRRDRISEQIRRELAEVIRSELKDPRVGMISLTDVEVSAGLRACQGVLQQHGG